LEHFQEKWEPVFRPQMRQDKGTECPRESGKVETPEGLLMHNLVQFDHTNVFTEAPVAFA